MYIYIYTYLEPKWPLFLKVNSPRQGLFQSKQGSSKGCRYILISILSGSFNLHNLEVSAFLATSSSLSDTLAGNKRVRCCEIRGSVMASRCGCCWPMAGLETRETRNPAGRKQHMDDMTCLAFTCHEASILKDHTHFTSYHVNLANLTLKHHQPIAPMLVLDPRKHNEVVDFRPVNPSHKKKVIYKCVFFSGSSRLSRWKKRVPQTFLNQKNDLGFVGRSWNLQIKKPTKTQKLHFVLYSYWLRIRLGELNKGRSISSDSSQQHHWSLQLPWSSLAPQLVGKYP